MSYLFQLAAAKLPVLAGGGILGVSIVGSLAGVLGGISLSVGAEALSALAGMIATGAVVYKQRA